MQADVTHVPFLFARNPGWHAIYDQDGGMAEADTAQGLRHAGGREDAGAGFHYPFPSLAHVEKSGTGYREIPVAWNPVI